MHRRRSAESGTRLHSRRRPVHYRRSPRADNMTSTVSAIYRYPVKGLSAEKMDRVTLMPGECLPHDRRFAVALGSTRFDPQHPEWLPKIRFVMLMRDEKLARLQTSFDPASGELSIAEKPPGIAAGNDHRAARTPPGGRIHHGLSRRCRRAAARCRGAGARLCRCTRKPHATTDKYVSLINRASIAALEAAMGAPVDPCDFARMSISRARRRGASLVGSAQRSPSEPRGCG